MPDVYGSALRPLMGQSPLAGYREAIDRAAGDSLLERCVVADQSYRLPGGLLMKTDAMSMANGVELRVPLLDRRIMEFSARCSIDLLVPGDGPTKPVLRRALRRRGAPSDVVDGPKRGFNTPLASLMRGPMRDICVDTFEQSREVFEPYLRPEGVRQLWRDHDARRRNHAYALWPMLTLGVWRSNWTGAAASSQRNEQTTRRRYRFKCRLRRSALGHRTACRSRSARGPGGGDADLYRAANRRSRNTLADRILRAC